MPRFSMHTYLVVNRCGSNRWSSINHSNKEECVAYKASSTVGRSRGPVSRSPRRPQPITREDFYCVLLVKARLGENDCFRYHLCMCKSVHKYVCTFAFVQMSMQVWWYKSVHRFMGSGDYGLKSLILRILNRQVLSCSQRVCIIVYYKCIQVLHMKQVKTQLKVQSRHDEWQGILLVFVGIVIGQTQ